jgi:hypothetical protein
MKTEYITAEVWVLVDAAGDYVASDDADLLKELYEEKVQELGNADGFRRVKLTVKIPLPQVIELAGEVIVNEEETELKTA